MKPIPVLLALLAIVGLFFTATASAHPPGVPGFGPPVPGYGPPLPRPVVYDRYYLPYYRYRLYLYPQYQAPPGPLPAYSAYPPSGYAMPVGY